jgi:formate-dependent nitrite reductase membrane component NrfD
MNELSIKRVGGALIVWSVLTYLLCVVWHLFVPSTFDSVILRSFLPGFDWTPLGVLIGLVLVVVYSIYIAVVFVSAYNFLGRQATKGRGA